MKGLATLLVAALPLLAAAVVLPYDALVRTGAAPAPAHGAAPAVPRHVVVCNGSVSGTVVGDVIHSNGGDCTVSANVTGSVIATNGGMLRLVDGAIIGFQVMANESASIHSSGDVNVIGGDGLRIRGGGRADLGPGLTVVKLQFKNITGVTMNGVNVTTDGVKVEMMDGDFVLCDSRIGNVVEFKGVTGDFLAVEGPNCKPNNFVKDVKIELVEGNVRINGSSIPNSELVLKEVSGLVQLENVTLFKAKIEKCGSVSFFDVQCPDTEVKENYDAVTVVGSRFGKIGCFVNSAGVTGTGNHIKEGAGQCTMNDLA